MEQFVLFLMGAFVPLQWVRLTSGSVLLVFGMYKLFRDYRHPKWVGMQVGLATYLCGLFHNPCTKVSFIRILFDF